MPVRHVATLVCAAGLMLVALSGCGKSEEKKAEHELGKAADVTTCKADAKAIDKPYGKSFPTQWSFPPRTAVYNYEDRGGDGTIVTGISAAPFKSVLSFLNHDAVDAGFKITEGETEAHDAEANWEGNGYRGRWAIKESANCPGETVVQVLAAKQ